LCPGSSSSCTGVGSGSRASQEKGRRSRSPYPLAMPNELILIVEDNPKNLKLMRDTLQVKGYHTVETDTGEEGVQLARERRPALILMDIQLPGMNGIEALRELRADPATRTIPVIAVTASVMAQDRQKIMAAGFDGFQGKPISVRELLATMRAILERPWPPRCESAASPPPRASLPPSVGPPPALQLPERIAGPLDTHH